MTGWVLLITLAATAFVFLSLGYMLGRVMESEQRLINEENERLEYLRQEAIQAAMRRHPSYHLRAVKDADDIA